MPNASAYRYCSTCVVLLVFLASLEVLAHVIGEDIYRYSPGCINFIGNNDLLFYYKPSAYIKLAKTLDV